MNHPIIDREIYLETAFERHFQRMLRLAWQQRTWHVIAADAGSGKSMGIRDFIQATSTRAATGSQQRYSCLAVMAPKEDVKEAALGNRMFKAVGLPEWGRWIERKYQLVRHLNALEVECLMIDNAQDLSTAHLLFLKELTDQGQLQYGRRFGLCLIATAQGDAMPLKEILSRPDVTWLQFRCRLDVLYPFCRIANHTEAEVGEILTMLETIYQEAFPLLNLRTYQHSLYTWLTEPAFDPTGSSRVVMRDLMQLITTALCWSYQTGETEVSAETLKNAAETLKRVSRP